MTAVKIKNVDTTDNVMLTCSLVKFIDVPLFTLYVIICIERSSIELFNPKKNHQVPVLCTDVFHVGKLLHFI